MLWYDIDRDNRSGPPDMGAQRKTDSETFGDSARHYRPRNFGVDGQRRSNNATNGSRGGGRPQSGQRRPNTGGMLS